MFALNALCLIMFINSIESDNYYKANLNPNKSCIMNVLTTPELATRPLSDNTGGKRQHETLITSSCQSQCIKDDD